MSSRLTSITRQQGAPSDDLVQTNPMPAASRMERALTSADAVVTGPSCGFGCALPKKQDAAAGVATVAMAAAPTRARAAYISASCQPLQIALRKALKLLWCGRLVPHSSIYEQCRSDTI